jgi:hypothetical protein
MGKTAAEIRRVAKFCWLSVSVLFLSSCSISGGDSSHIELVAQDSLARAGIPIKEIPGTQTYRISGSRPAFFTKIAMCGSGPYKHPLKVYMRELLVGHKAVTLLHNEEFDGHAGKALMTAGYTTLDDRKLTLCVITQAQNCLEHFVWWADGHLKEDEINALIQLASEQAEKMGI